MRERRAIAIRGIVQGVGFRPFVYALASRHDLQGFVKNQTDGVWIEVEGESPSLDRFLTDLAADPPPLARIEQLSWQPQAPRGDRRFDIAPSDGSTPADIFVSPDIAICADCLSEMFDPYDRRYRYPFLNCAHCGPRLTIITGAPYDRERTTMAGFPMCPACRAEYDDPANRRFHAQPTACAQCGPALRLIDVQGRTVNAGDPVTAFAGALRAGQIGALKGLGGYHLSCMASNAQAVAELRRRKHRDEKPFAVMVADVAAAELLCEITAGEREMLVSLRRPIVLLRKRAASHIAEEVAPANPFLGVMLPYTPLHHLLLQEFPGEPLVMTSGNQSDEPIAHEDADALRRLAHIADVFLVHNRPIRVRCDDSVTRVVAGMELPVRRSRGYAPEPIGLPFACPEPILAAGGQLKGTFALGRGRHAFLSHHLGDLDHYAAYQAFTRDIGLYEDLFGVVPAVLVHDLHPDYASTRYVAERAAADRGPAARLVAVQHHHAHMASCMVEHGLTEPVIGVTWDGTGLGTDGHIWGGEFLIGGYHDFQRAAHLRYVGMPGGDQAVHHPWRMALAHTRDAGASADSLSSKADREQFRVVEQMLARNFNTPATSSAGRLFDAVAALAGVRHSVSYEGQAAIELEWLATTAPPDGTYPFELEDSPREGEAPAEPFRVHGSAGGSPGSPSQTDWTCQGQYPACRANLLGGMLSPPLAKASSWPARQIGESMFDACLEPEHAFAADPDDQDESSQQAPRKHATQRTRGDGSGQAARLDAELIIDTRPLIRAVATDVAQGVGAARIARHFHSTLVEIIAAVCQAIRQRTGLNAIVLSGGVFLNALLTTEAMERLQGAGFRVHRHRLVPPNDGGLSLGQIAIAAARLAKR